MAISEARLRQGIIDILDVCRKEESNSEDSKEYFARHLARVIIEELEAAEIIGVCPPNGGALTQGKIV